MAHRNSFLYQPATREPFRISRSKIDLFLECPRCFYLDRRLGIRRPEIQAFALNSAVDTLLKNEFDLLRQSGERHALMEKYQIDALPFSHPDLTLWRDDDHHFEGAAAIHRATNFKVTGIVDDIWQRPNGDLIVVDYKATSTEKAISLEDEWKQGYKKQVEVYQWIFRHNGFPVADTAYFVFANAGKNRDRFDGRLEFELSIIAYEGDDAWVGPALVEIKKCLDSSVVPDASPSCDYCNYHHSVTDGLSRHGLPAGR